MRFSITSRNSPPGSGSGPSTESGFFDTGPRRSCLRAGVVLAGPAVGTRAADPPDPARFVPSDPNLKKQIFGIRSTSSHTTGCVQRCGLHGTNPGVLLRTIHTAGSLHKYKDWINGACTVCSQPEIPLVSPRPATPWIHPQRAQPLLLIPLDPSRSSSKSSPLGKLPVDNRIPTGIRGSSQAVRADRLAFNFTQNALRCSSIAGTNADASARAQRPCDLASTGSGRQAWWGYSEGTLWTWRRQRV